MPKLCLHNRESWALYMYFAFNWHAYHIGPNTDRAKLYGDRFLSYFQTVQVTSLRKMSSKYTSTFGLHIFVFIVLIKLCDAVYTSKCLSIIAFYSFRWLLLSLYLTLNILFQKVHNDDQFSYPRNDYLFDNHWIRISSQNAVTLVFFVFLFFFCILHIFVSCFIRSYNSQGRINVFCVVMKNVLWYQRCKGSDVSVIIR